MWLFTQYGFFSAVCTKDDPSVLKVRARDIDHLENLKERFPQLLGKFEISESPKADYRCRIIVPRDTWMMVCAELATDIDYDNFKNAVASRQGKNDYEHALHSIWSTMYGTQVAKYGAGIYSYQNRKHGAKSLELGQAELDLEEESEGPGPSESFEALPVSAPKRGNKRGLGKKANKEN